MPEQPIRVRLLDLAGQENCDGEPFDTMVEAAEHIRTLEAKVAWMQDEISRYGWQVEALNAEREGDPREGWR